MRERGESAEDAREGPESTRGRGEEGTRLGADDEQCAEQGARETEEATEEGHGRRDDVAEGEAADDAAEPDDVVRPRLLGEVLRVAERAHEHPLGGQLHDDERASADESRGQERVEGEDARGRRAWPRR